MKKSARYVALAVIVLVAGVLASPAIAHVGCTLTAGELTVHVDGDIQDVVLARSGDAITIDGAPCAGATVTNTDTIVVKEQTSDGGLNLHVDLSGGPFSPGMTSEADGSSEIEIVFEFGSQESDYDALIVVGSAGPDDIRVGTTGASYTSDDDADIEFAGELEQLRFVIQAGDGPDVLSALGGRGTGPPHATGVAFFGEGGDDSLTGGDGGDRLEGDAGADELDGGAEWGGYTIWDVVGYSISPTGVNVNLSTGAASGGDATGDVISNFDSLTGSNFDDVLTGDDSDNALLSGPGDDIINGLGGRDDIEGGPGADAMDGGDGPDAIQYYSSAGAITVDLGQKTISGGEGTGDTFDGIEDVDGSPNDDTIIGDAGTNELGGYEGDDEMSGGDGNDYLQGDGGDDLLRGGTGNDYFGTGAVREGADEMDGGPGDDTIGYFRPGSVSMSVDGKANDGQSGEGDNLIDIEVFEGGDSDDKVTGTNGDNTIKGRGGNDEMKGAGGSDRLVGGPGKDVFDGGPGKDTCVVRRGESDRLKSCERVVTSRHR